MPCETLLRRYADNKERRRAIITGTHRHQTLHYVIDRFFFANWRIADDTRDTRDDRESHLTALGISSFSFNLQKRNLQAAFEFRMPRAR